MACPSSQTETSATNDRQQGTGLAKRAAPSSSASSLLLLTKDSKRAHPNPLPPGPRKEGGRRLTSSPARLSYAPQAHFAYSGGTCRELVNSTLAPVIASRQLWPMKELASLRRLSTGDPAYKLTRFAMASCLYRQAPPGLLTDMSKALIANSKVDSVYLAGHARLIGSWQPVNQPASALRTAPYLAQHC